MARTKDKPAVRIARFEVRGVDRETRQRWMELSHATRRVLNDMRAMWLAEHYRLGNHLTVRQWRADDTAWAKTPKAERSPAKRVPCPVECWPKIDGENLVHRITKQLTAVHPAMNGRCVTLAVDKERKTMNTNKGSNSAYPQWMIALCGDGEFRQNNGPQPIPFDRDNARLEHRDGKWIIGLRVDRIPREGKTAVSHRDEVQLYTGGRRLQGLRTVLQRIEAGEYSWKGSSLKFRDGKWEVLLAYKMPKPERPELDRAKVARLVFGFSRPVRLWFGGFAHWLQRRGREIGHIRTSLLVQRWCRQAAYKDAGSGQKGHGRKKWMKKIGKLSRRWRDFTKTWNEQLARDVVNACVDRGYGALVYYQPAGSMAQSRFVATAGKVQGRTDSSAWDYYQLKSLLERRCEEVGIEFSVQKLEARRTRGKGSG